VKIIDAALFVPGQENRTARPTKDRWRAKSRGPPGKELSIVAWFERDLPQECSNGRSPYGESGLLPNLMNWGVRAGVIHTSM
jgi:hypothetical protein